MSPVSPHRSEYLMVSTMTEPQGVTFTPMRFTSKVTLSRFKRLKARWFTEPS